MRDPRLIRPLLRSKMQNPLSMDQFVHFGLIAQDNVLVTLAMQNTLRYMPSLSRKVSDLIEL